MATIIFDGTTSQTATKADTVLITANPQTFVQASDNGANTTLNFGASTLTITGTTLGTAGNLPNVFVAGGTFSYGPGTTFTNVAGNSGNVLAFSQAEAQPLTATGVDANSKIALFGGAGRVDATDSTDIFNIGSKGNFQVFAGGGADTVQQSAAFDSASIVNVNGDGGADSILLNTSTNANASIFVGGGAGADTIAVVNAGGATTIQGGLDSTDATDIITFNGTGTVQIYGNGGADSIVVTGLDSTGSTTVYGGFDSDTISVTGNKSIITVFGNEGADSITATNGSSTGGSINALGGDGADSITVTNLQGNTFITGGNQTGDQSNDGADTITFTGSGNAFVFGNVGADSISTVLGNGADTTSISIYGGKDNDTISQTIGGGTGKATIFIAGGEGVDSIVATGNGGGVTIFGGISNADSTDAGDNISFSNGTNGGALNIFGNGGADTIQITGNLGVDTVNIASVSGGIGNDSIVVAAQGTATTTAQQLQISGNDGNDTFRIAKGFGQTVTITDFNAAAGADSLQLTGAGTGQLQVVGGTFSGIQAALDAAANATTTTTKAAAVVFQGNTYVVIDSAGGAGAAGYSAATDQAIKLTGTLDLFALRTATTLA